MFHARPSPTVDLTNDASLIVVARLSIAWILHHSRILCLNLRLFDDDDSLRLASSRLCASLLTLVLTLCHGVESIPVSTAVAVGERLADSSHRVVEESLDVAESLAAGALVHLLIAHWKVVSFTSRI